MAPQIKKTAPVSLDVVFRAEKSGPYKGQITAVFPSEYERRGMYGCYAHTGQHSACSRDWYYGTRAATPDEYADLLAELRGIYERGPDPVSLRVVTRAKWA